MNQQTKKKTPEQTVEAIFSLDLDPIKLKLMDKDEGHGWTRAEADHHELEYRRFLALLAKFPNEVIAPDTNVDKFWHGHILDTMKYAEDCQNVFGYFLHHFPYFGMRDEEDAANLASAAVNMQRLYQQEFGEAQSLASSYCARASETTQASAYCARATETAEEPTAAYCARATAAAQPATAYCARATEAVKEQATAYCARATDGAQVQATAYCARVPEAVKEQATAYCARAQASYCAAAVDKDEEKQLKAAYCARAQASYCASTMGTGEAAQARSAYCARAAADSIVVGKGRPKLEAGGVA